MKAAVSIALMSLLFSSAGGALAAPPPEKPTYRKANAIGPVRYQFNQGWIERIEWTNGTAKTVKLSKTQGPASYVWPVVNQGEVDRLVLMGQQASHWVVQLVVLRTGRVEARFEGPTKPELALSGDGKWLAFLGWDLGKPAASQTTPLRWVSTLTGARVGALDLEDPHAHGLTVSPAHDALAVMAKGRLVTFPMKGGSVSSVSPPEPGRLLGQSEDALWFASDKTLYRLDPHTLKPTWLLSLALEVSEAYHLDETSLILRTSHGPLAIEVASKRQTLLSPKGVLSPYQGELWLREGAKWRFVQANDPSLRKGERERVCLTGPRRCISGQGSELHLSTLERYEGTFSKGQRHGQGMLTPMDGPRYQGQFHHGLPHGQGQLLSEEGWRFEATFKDGQPLGEGLWFESPSATQGVPATWGHIPELRQRLAP